MKSDLALVFESNINSLFIKVLELPDRSRNYLIRIPPLCLPKFYNFKVFGLLKLNSTEWFIHDTIVDKVMNGPKWILISGGTASKLQEKFYKGHPTVTVAVIHSHQVEFIPMDIPRRVQNETEL